MTVIGHGYDDNVGAPAFRNVIINGGMSVAQRNTSVASITASSYNTADRWQVGISSLGTWTQSVENDAPTGSGHRKSLKMLCTTADASPAASDLCFFQQQIEGQNVQYIAKGTSLAEQLTLSFWVKSNVTGTYIVMLYDGDNNRSVSKSYTINASATWEKKTIVFPADTTGVLDNDANSSLTLRFELAHGSNYTSGTLQTSWGTYVAANEAVGQTNLASAINNYWQITGVQLEAGSVATPFEFEPFETTLRKCQRYFTKSTPSDQPTFTTLAADSNMNAGCCWITSSTNGGGVRIPFPVEMRAVPTVDFRAWTSVNDNISNGGSFTSHAPGLGDLTSILEYKSKTGLSIYTTAVGYRSFFFWRANAEL